eukprot:TRINITY_DN52571_c0_g1_i1.p1 TRINITY_DN52571_c0_g1~~TRINITY_DN52571_c0_g1_i1.p1  ORF type:complete len:579 (-),score=93.95 TRINITY_DN52571_c0_g1_i1:27-1763(-)
MLHFQGQSTFAAGGYRYLALVVFCARAARPVESELQADTLSGRPSVIRLANQNLLGEAYNPVEFLQSDEEFMSDYTALAEAFSQVTTEQLLHMFNQVSNEMGAHTWKESDLMERVDPWMTSKFANVALFQDYLLNSTRGEPFLKKDNNDSFPYESRTNLICGGALPGMSLSTWRARIQGQVTTYKEAPELLVWDIACNLAAAAAEPNYNRILRRSYLNAAKNEGSFKVFIDAALDGVKDYIHIAWKKSSQQTTSSSKKTLQRLWNTILGHSPSHLAPQGVPEAVVVMGAEEFPEVGPRREALETVLRREGLKFIPPMPPNQDGSSGVIYSSNLPDPPPEAIRPSPLGVEPEAILEKLELGDPSFTYDGILQTLNGLKGACETKAAGDPKKLAKCDYKILSSFKTSARKTLVVDFQNYLRFVVIHAKEFKHPYGYQLLARYAKVLALMDDFPGMTAVVTDANTAKVEAQKAFILALEGLEFAVNPRAVDAQANTYTTQKKRSILHGQIYDKSKSDQLVSAQKDYIAVYQPTPTKLYELKEPYSGAIMPDLSNAEALLPNDDWASDHSMVLMDLLLTESS